MVRRRRAPWRDPAWLARALSFHGFDGELDAALRSYQAWIGAPSTGRLNQATIRSFREWRCAHPQLSIPIEEHERRFHTSTFRAAILVDRSPAQPEIFIDTSMPPQERRYELVPCRWAGARLTFALVGAPPAALGTRGWDAVRTAFATWSAAGVLMLEESAEPKGAEIRVMWTPGAREDPSSPDPFYGPGDKVAVGYYPYPHLGALAGDLHLDTSEEWAVEESMPGLDVQAVALHEIGHCVGLGHCRDESSVMWPLYRSGRRQLTSADTAELRRHYAGLS